MPGKAPACKQFGFTAQGIAPAILVPAPAPWIKIIFRNNRIGCVHLVGNVPQIITQQVIVAGGAPLFYSDYRSRISIASNPGVFPGGAPFGFFHITAARVPTGQ